MTQQAAALADRLEALPVPANAQARQDRLERVARLHAVVRAGRAFLSQGPCA